MFALKIIREDLKFIIQAVSRCNFLCPSFSFIKQGSFSIHRFHAEGIIYKYTYNTRV